MSFRGREGQEGKGVNACRFRRNEAEVKFDLQLQLPIEVARLWSVSCFLSPPAINQAIPFPLCSLFLHSS